jgi:hypothetical protein
MKICESLCCVFIGGSKEDYRLHTLLIKTIAFLFFFSLVGWKETIGLLAMRKGLFFFFFFLMFVCLAKNRTK